ncbi:microtubule integrity protein mal3 [Tilletia horrida]|uniref:Microtubule integrity protein mal3 n=1 Tax=Tilletia horrida TaxID=155126 RepID=A0AAN6JVD6_9BASI|nr:microtubule integrity protein mal3 [Tilletia horrida]KAK0554674.1 microtubule integrity protein mal3 [Tilletia horrida]KAK0569822.1 microtubule integrity protein mal3 [Tilletia horrida]
MGESRTELIQWLNELLGLHYTKVEQCGSGAAYCQIIDSIFGNVPLSKVRFDAKHEYEYVQNYKQLQEAFKRNKVDKPIPVERLSKCKMQDNLEFLQWLKKYWDTHYGGEPYDPDARRAGASAAPPPLHGAVTTGNVRTSTGAGPRAGSAAGSARGTTPAGGVRAGVAGARRPGAVGAGRAAGAGAGAAAGGVPHETIQALTGQMDELKLSVDGLEKERDFYFTKLRDIELLVQERLEGGPDGQAPDPPVTEVEGETLKQIQAILYSTEEGFEVPETAEVAQDELETF